MSGGVDSSVAAYLEKKKGTECIGITMKLFNNEEIGLSRERACCSLSDIEDARSVCRRLGIRYYVLNFTEQFKKEVIRRFVEAYENGCTPNPCIDCNRYLKFGVLFQRMKELDAEKLVTGHYARIEYVPETGRYLLKKALDEAKDQSYVLYMLTQEQLAHLNLPLGELRKTEVRFIAEKQGFANAKKYDSQDICFVPDGNYAGMIEAWRGKKDKPGTFVDKEGKILGTHRGIIHYTVGQRRGLGVTLGERMYVCDILPREREVVLGFQKDLYSRELTAGNVNLISCDRIANPMRIKAKIRYRQTEQPALAWQTPDGKLHVRFEEAQRAVTKGQSVVLYDGESVVGGGIIE